MTNTADLAPLNASSIARNGGFIVPSFSTPSNSKRFDDFVKRIDKFFPNVSHRLGLMICMIGYEHIRSLDDLIGMLNGLKDALITVDGIYVDWTSEGSVKRRKLADRTIVALAKVNVQENEWHADLGQLKTFLAKHYPGADRCLSKDVFEIVFHDSAAWDYFVLPRFCTALIENMLACGQLPRERLKAMAFPETVRRDLINGGDKSGAGELVLGWNASYQKLYQPGEFNATSCYCLEALKGVFSFSGQDGQLRVRDWRERAQIMQKVNSVAQQVLAEGTQVDALLLGWICHLLSFGSVKLNNPAAGTIANYFSVIAPKVAQAFSAAEATPGNLSNEGWNGVFEQVKAHLPATAHAAFLSFYYFSMECFGNDWEVSLLEAIPHHVTPRAAHITTQEFDRCLRSSVYVTRDRRACAVIQAIIALGWGCAPRIGEIWGLHLHDIVVYGSKVEVHFNPTDTEHEGKSRAARRAMVISDPVAVQILKKWFQNRVEEGALTTDFLFGDPHHSSQLYLMGECTRLVNQLMKQVCGDVLASFHDFRHAWVNRQVLQTLDGTEVALRFEELRVQLGHAPMSDTFLTSYFCMLEDALRTATDNYLCQESMDSATAAFWVGKTATALRAAKRRSAQPSGYFWDAIANHARAICSKSITPSVLVDTTSTAPQGTALGLAVTQKFLADVQSNYRIDAIGFRCGLDSDSLTALCAAVSRAYGQLTNTFVPTDPVWKVDQSHIDECRRNLILSEYDFSLDVEPAFVVVSNSLTRLKAPNRELRVAIQGWGKAVNGNYLSLLRSAEVVPLLRQLKELGLEDSVYQIRYACEDPTDLHSCAAALRSAMVQGAIAAVASVIRCVTQPLPVLVKKGTPSVYLVIRRTSLPHRQNSFAAAACRSKKLNGFLFSMLVWSYLYEGSAV